VRVNRSRRSAAIRVAAFVVLGIAAQIGSGAAASISIDAGDLTVATRTYGSARTCTLVAVADTYVNKALATSNFGGLTTILVNADSTTTERAFARFDLSTCSPSIPSDALVRTATLQLALSVAAPATRTYDLRRAMAAWIETSVTWNTQPAVAGVTASTTVTLGTAIGSVVTWTATGDVQTYVTGASSDLGWRISDASEGIIAGTPLTFGSREAATGKPTLVVTYLP
jgi:hypothetical protein